MCVCVWVSTYTHKDRYIHIIMSIYPSIYPSIHLSMFISLSLFLSLSQTLSLSMYLYLHLHLHLYLYLYPSLYLYLYLYLYIYPSVISLFLYLNKSSRTPGRTRRHKTIRFQIISISGSGKRHSSTDHAACIAPRPKKTFEPPASLDPTITDWSGA